MNTLNLINSFNSEVCIKYQFHNDVTGYDSDVAHEKNMDYKKKTYENPIRETTGVKPHEQEYDDHDR